MAIKPLHIVFIVLLLVVWVVMLAGVAAFHDNLSGGDKDEFMRPYWWGVWFEFFLLVLNVVALIMGAEEWHVVLVAFAAMASAYLMPHAEEWLRRDDLNGDLGDSAEAAAAGTIMVIIVNWILIILMGNSSFRSMLGGKAEAAAGAVTGPDA